MTPDLAKPSPSLRQIAALPLRMKDGRIETCLVTTRSTKRWTLPKGWPMKGRKDAHAARIEAKQEAGLLGKADKKPIGIYPYWKRLDTHFALVETTVYRLEVKATLKKWKEQGQREVQWMSLEEAALLVTEPGLADLLRELTHRACSFGTTP
ncbi:NUDIX hydrolase [Labrys sp. KB_33_2]|uniref:NUDIX hydrolase n=1 Tax=unclassified Labrys (in: a-proteobacteria) TaxID=2688601 RepID=UPI003EBE3E40